MRTGRTRFLGWLALLAACAACGGRSRTVRTEADPADAGGLTPDGAAAGPSDASAAEPSDASDDAPEDAADATAPCVVTSLDTHRITPEVIFAVPTSDATTQRLDDGRTAHEATAASLTEVLRRLDPRTYVGMALNPYEGECGSSGTVSSGRLDRDDQLDRLVSALGEGDPSGSTSVLSLLRTASVSRASLSSQRTVIGVFLDGAPVLDFECEGGPTALDKVAAELASLADQGVARTVFVAAPGSNAGDQARALAELGGCPDCFLDYSDLPDFADEFFGLMNLPGTIEPCRLPLPPPPDGDELDLASVTLVATFDDSPGYHVPPVDECGDTPGFTVSDDGYYLVLCEVTCERMLDSPSTHFELTSECTTR